MTRSEQRNYDQPTGSRETRKRRIRLSSLFFGMQWNDRKTIGAFEIWVSQKNVGDTLDGTKIEGAGLIEYSNKEAYTGVSYFHWLLAETKN